MTKQFPPLKDLLRGALRGVELAGQVVGVIERSGNAPGRARPDLARMRGELEDTARDMARAFEAVAADDARDDTERAELRGQVEALTLRVEGLGRMLAEVTDRAGGIAQRQAVALEGIHQELQRAARRAHAEEGGEL